MGFQTRRNWMLLQAILGIALATACAGQIECPPDGTTFLPHHNCSLFYVCSGGQEMILECPAGTYFDHESLLCDYPENVPECVGGTRPPGETEAPPTSPVTTPETTPEPTTEETTPEPGPVLKKCGETIAANSGRIQYKLNQNYGSEELCSFVIRVPDHSGILFTLDTNGINATADPNAISIFTFKRLSAIDTIHMGPPSPLTQSYIVGSLAVVVFRTSRNTVGTGFQLSFEGVGKTSYTKGVQLVYSNVTEEVGPTEITIPFWDDYGGTTNIIILTKNHQVVSRSFDRLRMSVVESTWDPMQDPQDCRWDSLKIFSFESETLTDKGVFCSLTHNTSVFDTNGLLIIVYYHFEENYWYKNSGTLRFGIVDP